MITLMIVLLVIGLIALLPYLLLAGVATWLVTSWWFWVLVIAVILYWIF